MERASQIKKLSDKGKIWDMVVVGGGATGLGVAVDAATRGMSVACLEKTDFAKCTSSRSTKLVHGGVRYLQKGDVMLVLEALRERGRMKANAPHLVKDQAFVISNYRYWDNFLYFCGLTFYDLLSFGFGYGRSKYISAKKVMKYIPTSVEKGLKGGVVYHDGQFDDSRMAVNLAQTCVENGGTVVNEATVTGILHNEAGKVAGVKFVDNTTGEEYSIKARSVVNAAGCFVDDIMHMDSPEHRKMVTPSQGVHLVLDMKFLQSDYAIMVPKTSDGRVLFAVPWHDKVVVGTTDIVRPTPEEEPRPLKEEIDFILGTDPDSDRVGIMVRNKSGEFEPVTGNQTGVLLLDYLIGAMKRAGKLPAHPAALKTIVTTEMARAVAEANGLDCYDTFTGFKFMAEKMNELESAGKNTVIFSYEESYGYMIGHYVRDKDAVTASLLLTGAGENEGKSSVAANLALALSMRGRHVLLLDLDLRKPALHKIFGLRTAAKNGIGQYLQAEKDAEPPLIFSEKYGISLGLTAPAAHPERLLHSEKLKKLLLAARADERFDYVLLDSPPMLLSADAEALSALSDLSVLVVRQDYTPAGILNDCADALTQSGTDFAGFILNDFYAAVHPQQLFAVRTASSK